MASRCDGGPLLSVRNLHTYFFTERGVVHAVNGVSFDVHKGELLGIVGESGCGKTVTALSILRLIDAPGRVVQGEIIFDGRDLLQVDGRALRQIRGNEIAMIFQNPVGALNPLLTVGRQITEAIRAHQDVAPAEARKRALALLTRVGIPDPESRLKQYPHQFSGGMAQRVIIAMALANRPKLLIADEPTTALDVTIQAQIVALLEELNHEFGMAVMHITHNIALVSQSCDRAIVMYGGKIAESGPSDRVFSRPAHPYTRALLESVPDVSLEEQELVPLEGFPPELTAAWQACEFEPRCPRRFDRCPVENPELREIEPGHFVRCHLY
jgi:oligopeptide/dipeptide ABC transporter ATP-binding protein